MILDLDSEASRDPGRAGAKAAWLARARHAGLPVLPGFVVESSASLGHMRLGAGTLPERGSGGARLVVGGEPIAFGDALVEAGRDLGARLVARSSTTLEMRPEWSGAFTSYLELSPSDLPKAVVGCWASAFSVDALGRQAAVGIDPGSFAMAVLVQPELRPAAGGTAIVSSDGSVVIHGIAGSPAPLLTGWSPALPDDELSDLIGAEDLDTLSKAMLEARDLLGATYCEWAVDGDPWILQLGVIDDDQAEVDAVEVGSEIDPKWLEVVRALARAPDALGEELILPWALGGLPGDASEPIHQATFEDAQRLSRELTAEVWGEEPAVATKMAGECLRRLQGPEPAGALSAIEQLESPDPDRATRLLAAVAGLRSQRPASRVGRGRWEPLIAAVVLDVGDRHRGTPAAPGVGAGVAAHVSPEEEDTGFAPRNVVVTEHPLPFAAPLLWDAAGVVTRSGSPAAHLFRSAGALGVPSVCGVDLDGKHDQLVAVDGSRGIVATTPLFSSDA